jgi:hypothetical protein
VAYGFAVRQLSATDSQEPFLAAEQTRTAAARARLLVAEGLGLQFQEGVERPLGEASGGGAGDLLQGVEVEVGAGAGVAEGAAGNDFAPLGGEGADVLKNLGW